MAAVSLTLGSNEYPLTVVDGTALTLSLSGPTGPAGPTGATGATGAAGPNTVSTSTSTNLTGYIYGNGTTVGGATAATSAATANTLVLRNASGGVAVSTINNLAITAAANSILTIDEDKGITLYDSITTEFGGYINTDAGGYIVTGVNGNITTGAGGYIQTGIGGHISTAAGGSFTTGTGNLTGPNTSGTIALTSDIPPAATVDATIINGSANAVSGNAVFDALALKAPLADPTLTGEVVINTLVGVNKDSLTINNTSDGDGQQSYGLKINKSGVDSFGLDVYVGPNVENGVGVYSSVSGDTSTGLVSVASGIDSKGAAIYSSGDSAKALVVTADGEYSTGIVVESSGTENVGIRINSTVGDYHAEFSDTGTRKSFVARLNGAFGWFRGVFTGRIQAADTLTEDRTYTLPDASGTVALINPSSGTQTFSGSQSFSSTTRPTSSGTGPPVATSLMTLNDVSNYSHFSRDLFRTIVLNASGVGASVRRNSAVTGLFDGDISILSINGSYIRAAIMTGTLDNYFDGSSAVSFSRPWTLFTKIALNLTANTQFYVGVGVDATTGIPSSGTNIGFQFTANNSVRLWRCNGGAAIFSTAGAVSNLPVSYPYTGFHYIWLECVGNGTINLYIDYAAFGSAPKIKPTTALCTLSGVGASASARVISSFLYATGTPGGFTSNVLGDCRFLEF